MDSISLSDILENFFFKSGLFACFVEPMPMLYHKYNYYFMAIFHQLVLNFIDRLYHTTENSPAFLFSAKSRENGKGMAVFKKVLIFKKGRMIGKYSEKITKNYPFNSYIKVKTPKIELVIFSETS